METCVVITLKIDTLIFNFFMINYGHYFLKTRYTTNRQINQRVLISLFP